jgi:hypothetical protein
MFLTGLEREMKVAEAILLLELTKVELLYENLGNCISMLCSLILSEV